MSSKHFIAKDWLNFSNHSVDSPPPIPGFEDSSAILPTKKDPRLSKFQSINLKAKTKLAPFNSRSLSSDAALNNNFINKQIIPGWTGDSLFSKAYRKIINYLHLIQKDAFNSLKNSSRFPKSYQKALYKEFEEFYQLNSFNMVFPENYSKFWEKFLCSEDLLEGEEREIYLKFFHFYAKKIALVYLLKVRLAFKIELDNSNSTNEKIFHYPQSVINQFFPPGSNREIKSLAFEANLFSWYRPNFEAHNSIKNLKQSICSLSYSDLFKLFNEFISPQINNKILFSEKETFSHAISHKNFGLFINSLLINFPLWISKISNKSDDQAKNTLLSTMFCGDQLNSIAESFFLAQENNKYIKWEQFIYPDFKKDISLNYNFYRICLELLSITFLGEIGPVQNISAKEFIPKTLKEHFINKKFNGIEQKNLLSTDTSNKTSHYNRILLNIAHVPKNNSLHYIFNKISKTSEFLKEDGYLFVLSNRKILLSSQKNKIVNLTKNLNLEAFVNLEDITGKGELPNYLYIFSKKDLFSSEDNRNFTLGNNNAQKENFFNLRLAGELDCFSQMEIFTDLIQDFFIDHIFEAPPLFQEDTECGKSIEFYQDVLIDGVVINSNNSESDHITHPSYFKTLMKSCQPISYFFELRNIQFEEKKKEFDLANFLNESTINYTNSNTILIVDKRKDNHTEIELIPSSILEAKKEDYGILRCHYFELIPKWPKFDQNLLYNFFQSSIGRQLINLTFSNENKKIKATLEKLLIPKIFSNNDQLNFDKHNQLSFLLSNASEIDSLRPDQIEHLFQSSQKSIYQLADQYPKECLSLLCNFKSKLIRLYQERYLEKKVSEQLLKGKFFVDSLKALPVQSIFPNNKDLFISFSDTANKNNLQLPLTDFKVLSVDSNNELCEIYLYHQNHCMVRIRTSYNFAQFLKIIFDHCKLKPIKTILLKLKIPSLSEFNQVVETYFSSLSTVENLIDECHKSFELILTKSISFR